MAVVIGTQSDTGRNDQATTIAFVTSSSHNRERIAENKVRRGIRVVAAMIGMSILAMREGKGQRNMA